MCDRCGPKLDYEVRITLNPKRREALGKAIGLVNLMAQKSPDPAWKDLAKHLEPVAAELKNQIKDIDRWLGKEVPV